MRTSKNLISAVGILAVLGLVVLLTAPPASSVNTGPPARLYILLGAAVILVLAALAIAYFLQRRAESNLRAEELKLKSARASRSAPAQGAAPLDAIQLELLKQLIQQEGRERNN